MKKRLFLSIILTGCLAIGILQRAKTKEKASTQDFVTLEYQGELGNKLFQTAAAVAYAKENNLKLVLPKKALSSKGFRNMLSRLHFDKIPQDTELLEEENSPYVYKPLPKRSNCCLKGFFISEKYFKDYQKDIKELFAISKRLKFSLQRKHPKIFNHPCSVALHIRTFAKDLGGFGNKLYETYPPPDLSYIKKAISQFPDDALFVICSDRISWCKKFLKGISKNFYFVEGQKNFEDLYLMSLCDHMITSNSTFSWWAAYLNSNPNKKVIARSPWIMKIESKINDIVPSDWIIIEGDENPNIPNFL